MAGGMELLLFHPVDTVAKRLMTNKDSLTGANWGKVIFQDKAEASLTDARKREGE